MEDTAVTSKVEANYIKDGGDAPCSGCVNFLPSASCKLVSGTISPEGSCDLFSSPASDPLSTEGGSAPLPDLMTQLFGGSNG